MCGGEVREEFYTTMRADKELEKEYLKSGFDNWKVSLTMAWPSNVPASDLRWATPLDHPGRAPRISKEQAEQAPYRV